MILVISRFRVVNEMEADVARAFRERPHLVDDQPGFLGMEVFTGPNDPAMFHLVTRWTDVESYHLWHHGEQHRLSHKGIPKGLKLDPAFTSLQILDKLAGDGRLPALEDSAPDEAPLIRSFLESTDAVCLMRCDREGRIAAVNGAFARLLERPAAGLIGETVWRHLVASDVERMRKRLRADARTPRERFLANFATASRAVVSLSCQIDVQLDKVTLLGEPEAPAANVATKLVEINNELAVLAREDARRKDELDRARNDLQRTLDELNASHWHLRKIQEVLPICMDCGKVRAGAGGWESVVDYLKENSLFLSHGFCPECEVRMLARVASERGEP